MINIDNDLQECQECGGKHQVIKVSSFGVRIETWVGCENA